MTADPSPSHQDSRRVGEEVTGRHTPLAGYRVGITSARKVDELTGLLERRGALVESAPVLAIERVDAGLRALTESCIGEPPDVFVATTGAGIRGWLEAARTWGMYDGLLGALRDADIIARGAKTVGALRAHGLRELWVPASECLDDVLTFLRGSGLDGRRVVVQEHGRSLSVVANALRQRGADVRVATVYRCEPADDQTAVFRLVDLVAERKVDAVTFTSAPAAQVLMDVAAASGRRDEVVGAMREHVLAACVGPVTAAPFDAWGVPTVQPSRARLTAMVRTLETELPGRRTGTALEVGGCRLLLHGGKVLVDGVEVALSPAPFAVLRLLARRPGHVVSRRELLAEMPSGFAGSEHAVEMAVARLRSAVGAGLVQTVVKRGYRLRVG